MTHYAQYALISLLATSLVACGGAKKDNTTDSVNSENNVIEQPNNGTSESETVIQPVTEVPATPVENTEPELSTEFADLPSPYKEASYSQGKRVFRLCSSCHVIGDGTTHGVGPDMHGIFTRKVGAAPGFNYSDAVKEADFDWTPEQLDEWLASPRSFLPGNRMSFSGVRKPGDRTAVIAYLMAETAKVED